MNKMEKLYRRFKFRTVKQLTLNPDNDAIHIHLLASRLQDESKSIVIINGQFLMELNSMLAVILAVFIDQISKFAGNKIGEDEIEIAKRKTLFWLKLIYRNTDKTIFLKYLRNIFEDIHAIARGSIKQSIAIGKYADSMIAPHRMDLMISSMRKDKKWHCNQKCLNCYAAGQTQAEVEEISTDSWKQIINKCRKAGIPQLTFTGGEPTLRSDLVELVKEARDFITRINTNGVLLESKELCKQLHDAELDGVQITLYSSILSQHEQMIGNTNCYEKTIKGIENAIEAGLNVTVNTPICRINSDSYIDTLKFLNNIGVKRVSCSGFIFSGGARETSKTHLEVDEFIMILQEAVEYAKSHDMSISFTSPGLLPEEELIGLNLDIPTCGACMSNMAIAPNGDVMPCQSWLDYRHKLGSMINDSWDEIWDSPVCKSIRNNSAKMLAICPLRNHYYVYEKDLSNEYVTDKPYLCSCAAGGGNINDSNKDIYNMNLTIESILRILGK